MARYAVGSNDNNGIMTAIVVITEQNVELFREGRPMKLEFRLGAQVPFDLHVVYVAEDEEAARFFDELCGPKDKIQFHDTNNYIHPGGSDLKVTD